MEYIVRNCSGNEDVKVFLFRNGPRGRPDGAFQINFEPASLARDPARAPIPRNSVKFPATVRL
jgi:hypothetical protein